MNFHADHGPGGAAVYAELSQWFCQPPGSLLAQLEAELLARVLPDLFGYHIVQLGRYHGADLLTSSRITHQLVVDFAPRSNTPADLLSCEDALPIAANSIDVLVLPHVLEYATDARRVLREAERVLIGEGHIVMLVFNRWSWFGLTSLLRGWLGHAPWHGRFIGANRVKDWLQLLGFDIVKLARAGYRPPLRHVGLNRRLAFLEKLGAYCWPVFGNAYMVVAKKRVEGITPLKTSWRQRRRLVAGSVAEPSARKPAGQQQNQKHEH